MGHGLGLRCSAAFVVETAAVGAEGGEGDVAGGFEEPGGGVVLGDGFVFAGGDEEDGLGDVFGEVGVSGLAEGGGIDEVEVGGEEGVEGCGWWCHGV